MSKVLALSCPLCGGAVGAPVESRILRCAYCGRRLFYAGADFVPRLSLRPEIGPERAQELFFGALRSAVLPPDLQRGAIVLHKRRRFMPFYLLSGKRGGVLQTVKERVVQEFGPSLSERGAEGGPYASGTRGYSSSKPKIESTPDARVVLGDFHYIYSAVALGELDIPEEALEETARAHLDDAEAADLSTMTREGEILEATIPLERILERGVASWKGPGGTLTLLEVQARILYVPTLEIVFRYGEQIYSILIDEVAGRVVGGHLPFRREVAMIAALPIAGALGLIAGKILRVMLPGAGELGLSAGDFMGLLFWLGIFMSFALGVGLHLVWMFLRTPMRVDVLPGGDLRVLPAGPTPDSPFAPLNHFLAFIIGSLFETRRPR